MHNEMNILIKFLCRRTDDGIASKIHVNALIIMKYRDIKTSAMDSTEEKKLFARHLNTHQVLHSHHPSSILNHCGVQ